MSQLEADREQQRLDAIMSRRAMGLYSSSGGTRTRAATTTTTTPPKWAAQVTTARVPSTAPRAPTAAAATATIGTGACALTTASAQSPPPVPPRSPVMAPPPVPPRSPLLEPTPPSPEKAVAIDDSEATPCEDDQAYRAKCEKQRLDKYISGEWRLVGLLRADSGVTKTKTKTKSSSSDAEATERQRERDHKETCDLATKRSTSVDTLETELFIDELVHLLRKATTTATADYDNALALSIVRKAKEVKDAVVNIITASTSPSTSTARISDDVNALAGTIARLVNGWREGTAVDEEAAGGVAGQAAQLQHQLRQLALAQ